jgi:hypothetical protein
VLNESGAHVAVYRVLDDLLAGTGVPPGARGAMSSIIDGLRASSAPIEERRRAEQISIEMHKLEWALQRADERAASAARDELKSLAAQWIEMRIGNRH